MGKIGQIPLTGRTCSEAQVREGARNMLVNGCGATAGTQVLIINQPGLVEPAVADVIEQEARALGAQVYVLWADEVVGPEALPQPVMDAMRNTEVVVFNHMLAGLLRLVPFDGTGLKILNFCTTWDTLGSEFARVPYGVMVEVMKTLSPRLAAASRWQITCPLGSDFSGVIEKKPASTQDKGGMGDGFTLRTFPLSVSAPVMSMNASGKLAIRWLTPAGIHKFDEPGITLPSPVLATLERGHMVDFEGAPQAVAELKRFLEKIGAATGKDGYIVNSWHAGTNPRCFAHVTPQENLDAWMYMVHGNPRIAHFHTIGEAPPGEMSIPLVDPTIRFDDEVYWQAGHLSVLEDRQLRQQVAKLCDPEQALRLDTHVGV